MAAFHYLLQESKILRLIFFQPFSFPLLAFVSSVCVKYDMIMSQEVALTAKQEKEKYLL